MYFFGFTGKWVYNTGGGGVYRVGEAYKQEITV